MAERPMFDPGFGYTGHVREGDKEELLDYLRQIKSSANRRFPAGPESMTLTIQQAMDGKLRSIGQFTAGVLTAQTVLTDARIAPNSFLSFAPRSASAATEIAQGTLYAMTQANGSATIAHSNITAPDRIFTYVVLGG